MSEKYRIKLKNERIIGPFTKKQVGELYLKGYIEGDEDCQVFPSGDWKCLLDFGEISDFIKEIIAQKKSLSEVRSVDEGKTVFKMSLTAMDKDEETPPEQKMDGKDLTKGGGAQEEFKEFKYSPPSESDEEETIIDSEETDEDKPQETAPEVDSSKISTEDEERDRTKIVQKTQTVQEDVDKTIVRTDQIPFPKAPEEDEEEKDKEKAEEEAAKENMVPALDVEQKTDFINLDEHLSDLKMVARTSEKEFEEEIARREREIQEEEKKKLQEEEEEVEEVVDDEAKKKRIKTITIAVIALVALYLLFGEGDKKTKKIVPVWAKVSFPISEEYLDEEGSKNNYVDGLKRYEKGTHQDKIASSKKFYKSMQKKFRENKAIGKLILVYSELLPAVKKKEKAASVIYRLIKIAKSKLLTDIDIALGTAIFYLNLGKELTALNIIENYLRVSKPSLKLLSYYLHIAMRVGELDKANNVYVKLVKQKKLPVEGYYFIYKYLLMDQKQDEAYKILEAGRKVYPKSVRLLLSLGEHLAYKQDKKTLQKIILKIKELQAEKSPAYFAKYLELAGLEKILSGKNDLAAQYFKKALKIVESDELRSKLAALELGGSQKVENLILESKITDLVRKSKKEVREKNWKEAFRLAIDAVDMSETFIPSRLWLAQLQIKRGYFKSAIDTLLKLRKEHSLHPEINFSLINAYVEARILDEAHKQIVIVSNTKFSRTGHYASVLGRYYIKKGNFKLSLRWLNESLNRNPINDKDHFVMAKLFLRYREYKNCKASLLKAIMLDPENIEYRLLYAKILYELDTADVAIGYLRDLLEKYPDNPAILSHITIYYHRSGKIKDFKRYKEKIEKQRKIDISFYEFLINIAKLEDRTEDVFKYSQELIRLKPGDLDKRMLLGEYLIKLNRLDRAEAMFKEVLIRLKSYPKVNYYLAKVYMLKEKYEKALEYADAEAKANPSLEFGYLIAGEIFKRMYKYPEAIRKLERAISVNGKSVESLMSLAEIKFKQNYFDMSRELYLRALKHDKGNPKIYRQLGYIYHKIGQNKLAVDSFNTYLKLNPGAKDQNIIQSMIRRLR